MQAGGKGDRAIALMREKAKLEQELASMLALQEHLTSLQEKQGKDAAQTGKMPLPQTEEDDEGEGETNLNSSGSLKSQLESLQKEAGRLGKSLAEPKSEAQLMQDLETLTMLEQMLDQMSPQLTQGGRTQSPLSRSSSSSNSPRGTQGNFVSRVPSMPSTEVEGEDADLDQGKDNAITELLTLVSMIQQKNPQAARQLLLESGFDGENIGMILDAAREGYAGSQSSFPGSPRVVELPNDDDIALQLEEQVHSAQSMLAEVHQLREAIEEIRNSPERDDPVVQQQQAEVFAMLLGKLDELERKKTALSSALGSERSLHKGTNGSSQADRKLLTAGGSEMNPSFQSHQQGGALGSIRNNPMRQGQKQPQTEVHVVMRELEQARELGRQKSLQLKRHEQEVATLQRNIQRLEERLFTLKPGGGFENSSQHGTISSEYVEAGSSVKSFDGIAPAQSPGSRDSISDSAEEDEEEEATSARQLAQADDDDDEEVLADEGSPKSAHDDADEDGLTEDGAPCDHLSPGPVLSKVDDDEEEDDELESGDHGPGASDRIGELRDIPIRSARALRSVEETSTTARAGSTAGDYQESIDDISSEPVVLGPGRRGRNRRVYLERPSRSELGSVRAPPNRFLDTCDWSLLLQDIYEFIDDCRSLDQESQRSDRDFGRQMVNFFTKLLSELGHIDLGSAEKQREALKALRRLSR